MRSKQPSAEVLSGNGEVLSSRERFYVAASLEHNYIICFDERDVAEAESGDPSIEVINPKIYLHAGGGALSIPYNQAILEETDRPFGVRDSFEARAAGIMPDLIAAGIKPAVHSDVNSEKGRRVHNHTDGVVGCGYAEARPVISLSIAEQISDIVNEAAILRPELFGDPSAYDLAHAIGAAHRRLAERQGFLTSGRRAVLGAATNGAKMMLMNGRHTARKGVINLVPGTTFDSVTAVRNGHEAYNQDSWAIHEASGLLQDKYPTDEKAWQIAELIDAIGTMRVLGVDEIVVRRP